MLQSEAGSPGMGVATARTATEARKTASLENMFARERVERQVSAVRLRIGYLPASSFIGTLFGFSCFVYSQHSASFTIAAQFFGVQQRWERQENDTRT